MDGKETADGAVVTLEFDVSDAEVFMIEASEAAECTVTLEEMVLRSDGTVLEFVTFRGADPARIRELAGETDHIVEARLLGEREGECLFEFIVDESPIGSELADAETIFKGIEATAGRGRLVADVPPHVDPNSVIEGFLAAHPGAKLVARRNSGHSTPTFTEHEFRDRLVNRLTDRQLETLRVAYANGYFDWPRRGSTAEIAAVLGVSAATVSQHLRIAQGRVFGTLFEGTRDRS